MHINQSFSVPTKLLALTKQKTYGITRRVMGRTLELVIKESVNSKEIAQVVTQPDKNAHHDGSRRWPKVMHATNVDKWLPKTQTLNLEI